MRIKNQVEGEDVYETVNCWVLSTTMSMEQQSMEIKYVVTWWMAKSDLHAVHGRYQMYVNDTLTFEREFNPEEAPEEAGEPPEPVDVNYFVEYETITVVAGTFTNCFKVEVAHEDYITRSWVHQTVPIWGLVKTEVYKAGEQVLTMELIAYGG